MFRSHKSLTTAAVLALAACPAAYADPAAFDLAGPTLEVEVSRGGTTLPASEVPNLKAGDRVWLKAELPAGQSARYLLVAAFLRGSTNPPPASSFFRCDTWDGKCSRQGMTVTVPKDAQQFLVFFAPETGGDYSTLLDAVRGRPGAFVRTSQDLNQATLDRSRLETYLTAIRRLADTDPASLKEAAPLLARSLAIKVDEKCLDKTPVLQAPCLMQGRETLILSDGHSTSMTQELTSGPASDLAMQASSTPQMHSGYYGPFVGSLLDIARILDSFHTAQYQYIPALASGSGRQLDLTLNTAPSFHDPKSVLVAALPAVEATQFPPLHPVDPTQIHCTTRDSLVLPADGAPLMFSTPYAHDMALRVLKKDGASIELPARADPARGGFAVDTKDLGSTGVADGAVGSLHGYWGFDKYEGPTFKLVSMREQTWSVAAGDAELIVGREDTVHLLAGSVSCIEQVALSNPAGKDIKVAWTDVKPDQVEIRLPLQDVAPGDMTLQIRQYGEKQPRTLRLHAFAEAAHVDTFALHAGDSEGALRGTRLDEVQSVTLSGVQFVPGALSSSAGHDELTVLARKGDDVSTLKQGDASKAAVLLKDGRTFDVEVSLAAPRPSAALIDKNAQPSSAARSGNVQLASADELPQDARLTFSLRATSPPSFAHDDKVEVATLDGSSSTVLGVGSGEMTLESMKVAVATLDPAKAFGLSAFGPLRFRRVSNGVPGDWRPLATLVRLPVLKGLECPPAASSGATCELSGVNLFLLDSLSDDPQFSQPTKVPDGFTGQVLPVQRPTAGRLYVKLRDDPSVVSTVAIDLAAAPVPQDAHPAAPHTQDSPVQQPLTQAPLPPAPPTQTNAAVGGAVNQAAAQASVSPHSP
jgi:hypothetical protein